MQPIGSRSLAVIALVLFTLFITACNDVPTGSNTGGDAVLRIIVKDDKGNPLPDVMIATYPSTSRGFTNAGGELILRGLTRRDYQVTLSRSDIPIVYKNVSLLGSTHSVDVEVVVPLRITLTIIVINSSGNGIPGVKVSTLPTTSTVLTDDNGYAVFYDIPAIKYTFTVSFASDIAIHYDNTQYITIINSVLQNNYITIEPQAPKIIITSPEITVPQERSSVHFSATVGDFEESSLPPESIVWTSSIDGVIGHGADFTTSDMSTGIHTIKVTCTDSSGMTGVSSITLYISSKTHSYFPFQHTSEWIYRYDTPQFELINDLGEREFWTMEDYSVRIDNACERICKAVYRVTTKERTTHYVYWVSDLYTAKGTVISVISTSERIQIWYSDVITSKPSKQIDIETVYSPFYPFLANENDIAAVGSGSFTIRGDVTWNLSYTIHGQSTFYETVSIPTSYLYEGRETVQTPAGVFDAERLSVTQGDTQRTYWFAWDIGMVMQTFDSFGTPLTVRLMSTTVGNSLATTATKRNSSPSPLNYIPLGISLSAPDSTRAGIRERLRILRALTPRM